MADKRTVRCKMKLIERTERQGYTNGGTQRLAELKFSVVSRDDSAENQQFFAYTPNGSLEFATVNWDAVQDLAVGEEFYVDITPADAD